MNRVGGGVVFDLARHGMAAAGVRAIATLGVAGAVMGIGTLMICSGRLGPSLIP